MKYWSIIITSCIFQSVYCFNAGSIEYYLTNVDVSYLKFNYKYPSEWYNAFKPSCNTVFIIHGWLPFDYDSAKKIIRAVSEEFMKVPVLERCYNVIGVTWSASGSPNYFGAANAAVTVVSANVAHFIVELYQRLSTHVRFDCVGHSLGAHICGNGGRNLKPTDRFRVITGLDAAGPSFTSALAVQNLSKYKLQSGDAVLVATLMTAAGFAGTAEHLGDVNFVANGGRNQPRCNRLNLSCSHERSVLLYQEAILHEYFRGYSSDGTVAIFGRYMDMDTMHGVYDFKTRAEPPYGSD